MGPREVLMEALELVPIAGPGAAPHDKVDLVFDSFEASVLTEHVLAALSASGYSFMRRANPLDCYECGKPCGPEEPFETHGRAGRVHTRCRQGAW